MLQNSRAKPRSVQSRALPVSQGTAAGYFTGRQRMMLSKQVSVAVAMLWAGQKLCSWSGTACLTAERITFCHSSQTRAVLKAMRAHGWNGPTCNCDPVQWLHGVSGVPWLCDGESLCACVWTAKKSPGWGREMLWMLWSIQVGIRFPLAGPSLLWPTMAPPSRLMVLYLLPARGDPLQGTTFRC